MPQTFSVTAPNGKTLEITGDHQPSEAELRLIFQQAGVDVEPSTVSPQPRMPAAGRGTQFDPALAQSRATPLLPTAGGIAGAAAGGPVGAALGGAVGEGARQLVTGEPMSAAGMATQGAIQGVAEGAGKVIGAGLNAAAPWLMQKALKPTAALISEYRTTAPKLVRTLLDEGVSVTQAGVDRLQKLFDATNAEIRAEIQNASGTVQKRTVAARALPVADKVSKQVNPTKDLEAVRDTVSEFMNHPRFAGDLTIPEAQALKVGTYQQIGKKYGELSSAGVETQKALARGLKEEIAAEVPGLAGLNAKDSELMAALDAVGRRVALSGNKDPVGFAWVAQHPTTFLASLFDRSPAVKSMVANGMWQSAGTAAKVAPQLIRAAVAALAIGEPAASPAPASSDSSARPENR